MSDWIRFHAELRRGEKRGLSRATRFVYLELSHEARPRCGVVVLPQRMGDVDAVHEVIAGNRKEIVEALRDLTAGSDPMVRFDVVDGKRVLVVVNWEKWNSGDSNAERQARLRKRRRGCNDDSNGTVTQIVTQDVTSNVTSNTESNGGVTLLEKPALARTVISSPLLSSGSLVSTSEQTKKIRTSVPRPSGIYARDASQDVRTDEILISNSESKP